MAQLLVLTSAGDAEVLPALGLLSHRTRQIPAQPASLITAPTCDLIFVDARLDLASAKSLCKILNTTGVTVPIILILTEGGLTAVSADWGVDDVILENAGPAEADARIRLAIGRQALRYGLCLAPRRRSQRHDPRSLPQCGRHRAVPGRLWAHLGKHGLVTVSSHPTARSRFGLQLA